MHLRTEVTRQHGSESDLIQLGPLKKTTPGSLLPGALYGMARTHSLGFPGDGGCINQID